MCVNLLLLCFIGWVFVLSFRFQWKITNTTHQKTISYSSTEWANRNFHVCCKKRDYTKRMCRVCERKIYTQHFVRVRILIWSECTHTHTCTHLYKYSHTRLDSKHTLWMVCRCMHLSPLFTREQEQEKRVHISYTKISTTTQIVSFSTYISMGACVCVCVHVLYGSIANVRNWIIIGACVPFPTFFTHFPSESNSVWLRVLVHTTMCASACVCIFRW